MAAPMLAVVKYVNYNILFYFFFFFFYFITDFDQTAPRRISITAGQFKANKAFSIFFPLESLLTPLCRMDSSTSTLWTGSFLIEGVSD